MAWSLFSTNNWFCVIWPTVKRVRFVLRGVGGTKRGQTARCEDTDGPYAGAGSAFAPLDSEQEARCLHVCLVCLWAAFPICTRANSVARFTYLNQGPLFSFLIRLAHKNTHPRNYTSLKVSDLRNQKYSFQARNLHGHSNRGKNPGRSLSNWLRQERKSFARDWTTITIISKNKISRHSWTIKY